METSDENLHTDIGAEMVNKIWLPWPWIVLFELMATNS